MRSTSMWLWCVTHVALAAGSAIWLVETRGGLFTLPDAYGGRPVLPYAGWLGIGAALATALLAVRATRFLVARARWARALHVTLRGALLGMSPWQMVMLAGTSACAEELFFRALLGPSLGFVSSSVLFGIVHGLWRERPVPFAVLSFGMGLAFCGLYLASGTLLSPMLAHCVINYENMQYICNYDPTPLDMDRFSVHEESEQEG